MLQVEQHIITRHNGLSQHFGKVDALCFSGKNLYNKGRYIRNRYYDETGQSLSFKDTERLLKGTREYRELPAKVAQLVRQQLLEDEQNYFKSLVAWRKDNSKFTGRPRFPGYKKKEGRATLEFNAQAVSRKALKQGIIRLGGTDIAVPTRVAPQQFKAVRLVPQNSCYILEVIYEVREAPRRKPGAGEQGDRSETLMVLDLGVDNTVSAAVLREVAGEDSASVLMSFLLCGRKLKSINQYFNKAIAQAKSQLEGKKHWGVKKITPAGERVYAVMAQKTSRRIHNLWNRRHWQIKAILHRMSHALVKLARTWGVDRILIGYNPGWKNQSPMGAANNQNFVQIPLRTLIHLISYKAEKVGIETLRNEESYTSKASALDGDFVPDYDPDRSEKPVFSGRRVKRGLYRTKSRRLINADINGALNIYRKWSAKGSAKGVAPAISEAVVGLCSSPVRILIEPNKGVDWLNIAARQQVRLP